MSTVIPEVGQVWEAKTGPGRRVLVVSVDSVHVLYSPHSYRETTLGQRKPVRLLEFSRRYRLLLAKEEAYLECLKEDTFGTKIVSNPKRLGPSALLRQDIKVPRGTPLLKVEQLADDAWRILVRIAADAEPVSLLIHRNPHGHTEDLNTFGSKFCLGDGARVNSLRCPDADRNENGYVVDIGLKQGHVLIELAASPEYGLPESRIVEIDEDFLSFWCPNKKYKTTKDEDECECDD